MDESPEDAARRAAELAEMNEIGGVTKWTYVPMFHIPSAPWKIGAIWDQAYLETAQYVLRGVVSRDLNPYIHGVVGVFLFRHYVELELKYILFHTRWLRDKDTNATKAEVKAIEQIHFLDKLWAAVKRETPDKIGREAWDEFDTAFIDEVVRDLNIVDPGSYGFRYSGKKFGEGDPDAKELWTDFRTILDQSQHVYNVLHTMKVYLIETYGMNAEWERELDSF